MKCQFCQCVVTQDDADDAAETMALVSRTSWPTMCPSCAARTSMELREERGRISEATGFDSGDQFTSEQQVVDYFQSGPYSGDLSQAERDSMAATVLSYRWHCAF